MAEPNEEPQREEPESAGGGEPPTGESSEVRERQPQSAAARRLAARRAAKQALKAARRHTEAEQIEDEAEQVAREATRWATSHGRTLGLGLLGLAVVLGGAVAWSSWRSAAAAEQAQALWRGVEAAHAPVVPEGVTPPPGVSETFPTVTARAEEAARRFGEAAGSLKPPHRGWAKLGEGAALLQLGKAEEAAKAFEAAKAAAEGEGRIVAGALEGLAHVAEAAEKWDEAAKAYEELGRAAGGRYRPLAELGLARVEAARGEKEAAIGRLKKLLERLGDGPRPGGEESYGELPFVRDRAEALLGQLDPNYAPQAGGAAAPGGQLTPEQLQRLLEQIRRQQGAGGGQ